VPGPAARPEPVRMQDVFDPEFRVIHGFRQCA
jgi:hypothetical protein